MYEFWPKFEQKTEFETDLFRRKSENFRNFYEKFTQNGSRKKYRTCLRTILRKFWVNFVQNARKFRENVEKTSAHPY